ncbi:hypothetical protein RB601_003238 [Gaeumannomyces tritici]
MADYTRILSDRLGEMAQRNACVPQKDLHDIELVRPVVPVGTASPAPRSVDRVAFDVWFVIFSHLEYSDAVAFSKTCRAFYSLAPSNALVTREQRHQFYLKAEKFRQHDGLLVCFYCMKLRPRSHFGNNQATKGRGKHGAHPDKAIKRHCWDCTAAGRLYPESQPLRKDKHLWYLCHQCGIFKHRSQRCLKEDAHDAEGSLAPRTVCTPAWPATVPSALESRLPAALQDRIVGHLGYRDRMSLAATNRHFRRAVRPLGAPLSDKVAVAKRAANWTSGPPRGGPWACMVCFRARPESSFPNMESLQSKWWRRRCRACCHFIHQGGHQQQQGAPPRQWHPLDECWFCRELKDAGAKCGTCHEVGPAWDKRRDLQARRERRRESAGAAADQDFSEPLSLLLVGGNAQESAEDEVGPVEAQGSDQPSVMVPAAHEEFPAQEEVSGQAREAPEDGDENTSEAEEKPPVVYAGGVAAGTTYRSRYAPSHTYSRLRRFLSVGYPLRRHHRPRTTWGAISERLKNARLGR